MMQKCLQFLNYAASQEDAIITYRASNMRLTIHSNASYLSEPNAQSRAGGHMFMVGTENIHQQWSGTQYFADNKSSDVSAAEAELGALFINAKMAVSMQHTPKEIGHPQTCTCPAHGNNLYGYKGRVLKIWYLKPTKVHVFKSILGFQFLPWACLIFLLRKA
jgi:hypothetical protein